jgi:putative transposase
MWILGVFMPTGLKRYYGHHDLHFVTFSCYGRRPLMDSVFARNVFVKVLRIVRDRYMFRLVGYVVMPDHVHLLMSEPEKRDPSIVLKALKHRGAVGLISERTDSTEKVLPLFWQPRFSDFNVYTSAKQKEKLDYMHSNPLTRGLVENPRDWIWSSYLFYETGEEGIIRIDPVD